MSLMKTVRSGHYNLITSAVFIGLACFCVSPIMLPISNGAFAHDSEQWIADKALADPISKQFCCGPSECHVLADGSVREVSGGWIIKEEGELFDDFVDYQRGLPFSPDSKFHRCGRKVRVTPGFIFTTKCLIVPPGNS